MMTHLKSPQSSSQLDTIISSPHDCVPIMEIFREPKSVIDINNVIDLVSSPTPSASSPIIFDRKASRTLNNNIPSAVVKKTLDIVDSKNSNKKPRLSIKLPNLQDIFGTSDTKANLSSLDIIKSTISLEKNEQAHNCCQTPSNQIRNKGYWSVRPRWVRASGTNLDSEACPFKSNTSVTLLEQPRLFFASKREPLNYNTSLDPEHDLEGILPDEPEYIPDHLTRLYELENQFRCDSEYMDYQRELKWNDRNITIRWLQEISQRLELLPSVIFLTVNLLDRFLSAQQVSKKSLPIVGLACCSLAYKFEMTTYPSIQELVHQSKLKSITSSIIKNEKIIITALDFQLTYPNPLSFISHSTRGDEQFRNTRLGARYILEECLADDFYLKFKTSVLTNAAFYISLKVFDRGGWSSDMELASGCTRQDLSGHVSLILNHFVQNIQRGVIYTKYSTRTYAHVSVYVLRYLATYHNVSTAAKTTKRNYSQDSDSFPPHPRRHKDDSYKGLN